MFKLISAGCELVFDGLHVIIFFPADYERDFEKQIHFMWDGFGGKKMCTLKMCTHSAMWTYS